MADLPEFERQLSERNAQIAYLQDQLARERQRADTIQQEYDTIRHAKLVRWIANPIWALRRRLGLSVPVRTVPPPAPPTRPPLHPLYDAPRSQIPPLGDLHGQTVVCTIIAKNYLAQARALMESVQHFHGDEVRRVVLLADEIDGDFDPLAQPFDLLLARDLAIPNWQHFAMKYTLIELSTAVKPSFIEYLFAVQQVARVIFLDPDILLYDRLDAALALLQENAVVLTPHLLQPLPDDGEHPDDLDIRRSGTYNLGFLGIADTPAVRALLRWWQGHLYARCVVDLPNGVFVDQSWADLIPGFIDKTAILRHPGYNVAYWNLLQRAVKRSAEGPITVHGAPLVFLHFSGYAPQVPDRISQYQTRLSMDDLAPLVRQRFAEYRQRLQEHGYTSAQVWRYKYGFFPDGTPITDEMRRLLRTADPQATRWPNPFNIETPGNFRAWARTRIHAEES